MKNNLKHSTWFEYFDIQNVGGKWYAWFMQDTNQQMKDEREPGGDE